MKYMKLTLDFHDAILNLSRFDIIQKSTDCQHNPAINFRFIDENYGKDFLLRFDTAIERDKTFNEILEKLTQ